MTKRVRITLHDAEYEELKALAQRERRTIGAQAAVMIHEQIPALKIRRTEDVQKAETHPVVVTPSSEGPQK